MAKIDIEFKKLCREILNNGREYENKNRGVKRLQIPSYTFRHAFNDGFPAITLKDLYWKGIVGELLWFLRGDNDVKFLNQNGIKIWNKDAYNWHKRMNPSKEQSMSFEEFEALGEGSVGQNYSVQWRRFNGEVDQIGDLIKGMKQDIMSSRLKVNAWNPSEIDKTALPPCHDGFQIIGVPLKTGEATNPELNQEFGFELHWNQRSVDTFLGLPFNIASYALLAKILEHLTGYKAIAIEGSLKCVHFYDNQYEAVKILMNRDESLHGNCELEITDALGIKELHHVTYNRAVSDFNLKGYGHEPAIKVEMLAPKE